MDGSYHCRLTVRQQRYKPSNSNAIADLLCSVHGAVLEYSSSGMIILKILESEIFKSFESKY